MGGSLYKWHGRKKLTLPAWSPREPWLIYWLTAHYIGELSACELKLSDVQQVCNTWGLMCHSAQFPWDYNVKNVNFLCIPTLLLREKCSLIVLTHIIYWAKVYLEKSDCSSDLVKYTIIFPAFSVRCKHYILTGLPSRNLLCNHKETFFFPLKTHLYGKLTLLMLQKTLYHQKSELEMKVS